jgi:transcriptional regulator with XRE-family HTH domain
MKIGELIQVARECKGWSIRELEKRTGISNAVISQVETGHIKSPSWRNVVKIAKALNLKLDRLAACEEEST